jgi:hypothetical protein
MMTKKVPSFSWVPRQPDRNLDRDDEVPRPVDLGVLLGAIVIPAAGRVIRHGAPSNDSPAPAGGGFDR